MFCDEEKDIQNSQKIPIQSYEDISETFFFKPQNLRAKHRWCPWFFVFPQNQIRVEIKKKIDFETSPIAR